MPLSTPKARQRNTWAGTPTGMSRTTGFLPRAMTISSPALRPLDELEEIGLGGMDSVGGHGGLYINLARFS